MKLFLKVKSMRRKKPLFLFSVLNNELMLAQEIANVLKDSTWKDVLFLLMPEFDWSPYGRLPQAVDENLIDGFFVPHEWGVRPPLTWPRGKALISILTPKGRHLIADGSWQNYGYPSANDFTEALREGAVMCKTEAGIVCLGPSRYVSGARIICMVRGVILDKTIELIAGNQTDLALLEAFIFAHFPGSSCTARVAGWAGQINASGIFNIREVFNNFSELDAKRKTESLLLLSSGMINVFGLFLAVVGLVWMWLAFFSMGGFVAVASFSMLQASARTERALNSDLDGTK
jgi:hypothetical protein